MALKNPVSAPNVKKLLDACDNPRAAKADLIGAVIGGIVSVAAHRAYRQSNGNLMPADPVQVSALLWRRIDQAKKLNDLWKRGAVVLPKHGKHGAVDLSGIAFEQDDVMAIVEMHRPPDIDHLKTTGPQGPKSAGRYGMPLAYVTMHLSNLTPGELRNLTNVDAEKIVTMAFRKLGMRAPHRRNAGEMGGGIRDALLNMDDSPWADPDDK